MILNAHDQLANLLEQEIGIAHELFALLEQERAVLTGASHEAVTRTAAEKAVLIERFERLDDQRRKLCSDAGIPVQGADAFAGASPLIRQRWQTLMGLIAACRNANNTNGLIVNLRQGQIRQLIDILRGGPSLTYGPRGQTFAKTARPLARA